MVNFTVCLRGFQDATRFVSRNFNKTESDLDQTQIGYAIAKGAVFVATFIIASSVGLTNHSR